MLGTTLKPMDPSTYRRAALSTRLRAVVCESVAEHTIRKAICVDADTDIVGSGFFGLTIGDSAAGEQVSCAAGP